MATAPATARSTNPIAIVNTSMMTTCFKGPEYIASSVTYIAATSANIGRSQYAAAREVAPRIAAAPIATATGTAPDAMGR